MAKKTGHPWERLTANGFAALFKDLAIVARTLRAGSDPQLAAALGVEKRTVVNYLRGGAPRGYNRRRDVLRDLARFVAEKAGEA